MQYINFGSAGLKVSQIALGLGLRGQADAAAAQRMIERAIDQGINLIDCANIYGLMDDRANIGMSEQILSKVLRGRRDQLVITSKVASQLGTGPNDVGSSRVHILREVDNSLRRLGTDYIDVYMIHIFDNSTPLEETVRALDDLVRSGKVRYIGCCNFAAWQVCHGLWVADRLLASAFMTVQNPYSLLDRKAENELLPMVRQFGLGFMAYSPLAVGLLSGQYMPGDPAPAGSYWSFQPAYDELMKGQAGRVVQTVIDIAQELGKSPAQVALAWILDHDEITCAIIGSDNRAQLEDNLGALGWQLESLHRQRLDEVSRQSSPWDGV